MSDYDEIATNSQIVNETEHQAEEFGLGVCPKGNESDLEKTCHTVLHLL